MSFARFDPDTKFDDSRIKNHPDNRLLEHVKAYFKTFTTPDPAGMRDFQTEEYSMTDIPLGVVRVNRDVWFTINSNFVKLTTGTKVTALSLYGSSRPGRFSALENLITFQLTADPPPGAADNLPPGAKAGDTVGMIMLTLLWWGPEGKITRELEYGKLTWKGFSLDAFDQAREEAARNREKRGLSRL